MSYNKKRFTEITDNDALIRLASNQQDLSIRWHFYWVFHCSAQLGKHLLHISLFLLATVIEITIAAIIIHDPLIYSRKNVNSSS